MKIVIVGDGKVGFTLTKMLSREGHDIVVIDSNQKVLQESQEALDVAVVKGNGVSVDLQLEAGVSDSDLLIAATSMDETNLLCCLVAKKLGCRNAIARIRNPEYYNHIDFFLDGFGLSMSINPERTAAEEIYRLLTFPAFTMRDLFAGGKVELVEMLVRPGSTIAGKRIEEIKEFSTYSALICAVDRDGQITIPSGKFVIEVGDKLTIASEAYDLRQMIHAFSIHRQKINRVLIIGGSRIATYLTQRLLSSRIDVTILEKDEARCEELSELLPRANIINGNGTSQELLLSLDIASMDAVVTLSGIDEENLIISMFANYIGVPKTITKIDRTEFTDAFKNTGIDSIVSPKLLTANEIMRYVRGMGDTERSAGSIENYYSIVGGKAEALEFKLQTEAPYQNIPLSRLHIKPNNLIACIIRGQAVIVPRGQDFMKRGDSVIVVSAAGRAIRDITDILETN